MPRVRAGIAPILTLVIGLSAADGASAQAPQSARLARLLAEAADGARTGTAVYFAANRAFPHLVVGPFENEQQARRAAQDSGSSWSHYGPYLTPRDSVDFAIVSVTVVVRRPDGRTQQIDIDPRRVDALFLSPAAVEKFAIPYYTSILGAPWATSALAQIMGAGGNIPRPPCHFGGTIFCELGPPVGRLIVPLDRNIPLMPTGVVQP